MQFITTSALWVAESFLNSSIIYEMMVEKITPIGNINISGIMFLEALLKM